MKICVPTMGNGGLDDWVGEHFGRVPTYTVVDLDTNEVKIIQNTSHHMGGHGDPPEIMAREGVNVMICQGLGRRAINMFESLGITVYIGASGMVRDAVDMFKQGDLQKASESDGCGKHTFRDRHHH
jgi:predicted Fe-Mo cluster-binding NifX family protein